MRSCHNALRDILALGLLLGLLWLGLAGGDELLFGGVAIAVVTLLSRRLAPLHCSRYSLTGMLRFVPYFLRRSLAGGLDVARRALHPTLPLEVHLATHRIELPPGQPRTIFIAVISLLPGTLASSIKGDTIQVHSIAGDPTVDLVDLERRIAALYAAETREAGAQ